MSNSTQTISELVSLFINVPAKFSFFYNGDETRTRDYFVSSVNNEKGYSKMYVFEDGKQVWRTFTLSKITSLAGEKMLEAIGLWKLVQPAFTDLHLEVNMQQGSDYFANYFLEWANEELPPLMMDESCGNYVDLDAIGVDIDRYYDSDESVFIY